MTISGIGQSMSLSSLYAMQKPNADDVASKIFNDLDIDGDSILSAEEISNGGEQAQNILGADTDGDGAVTMEELISDITNKMNSGEMPPPGMMPNANEMATNVMNELDTDGDSVLSSEEISSGGEEAQSIESADTNGDGVVSMDELLAYFGNNQSDEDEQENYDLTARVLDQYNDSLTTVDMLTSSNLSVLA